MERSLWYYVKDRCPWAEPRMIAKAWSGCHWTEWLCAGKELLGVALASGKSPYWHCRKDIADTRADRERASPPMGLFSDTGDPVWWPDCPAESSAAFTTCEFQRLLRKCYQGCVRLQWVRTSSPLPQRHESLGPGSMTGAVAYQAHEWRLAPLCPTVTESSPNTATVQDSLPDSSDSKHKEVP